MAGKDGFKEFKIKWVVPETLPTLLVHNFLIQHQPGLVYISAHQVLQPLPKEITGEDIPEGIDATAVVRLVMDVDAAQRLSNVLSENLKNWEKSAVESEDITDGEDSNNE